jgi:hypothetical protein
MTGDVPEVADDYDQQHGRDDPFTSTELLDEQSHIAELKKTQCVNTASYRTPFGTERRPYFFEEPGHGLRLAGQYRSDANSDEDHYYYDRCVIQPFFKSAFRAVDRSTATEYAGYAGAAVLPEDHGDQHDTYAELNKFQDFCRM